VRINRSLPRSFVGPSCRRTTSTRAKKDRRCCRRVASARPCASMLKAKATRRSSSSSRRGSRSPERCTQLPFPLVPARPPSQPQAATAHWPAAKSYLSTTAVCTARRDEVPPLARASGGRAGGAVRRGDRARQREAPAPATHVLRPAHRHLTQTPRLAAALLKRLPQKRGELERS